MYTRCPHCETVFAIGAAQLKAAHGSVRCGSCLESFDAIPHLRDAPDESDAAPAPRPAAGPQESLASTLQDARAELGERMPQDDEAARRDDAVADDSLAPADEGTGEAAGPTRDTEPGVPVLDGRGRSLERAIPDLLREDMERAAAQTRARRRSIAYTCAALALLAALGVQYAWFMPRDLAQRYPQWRDAVASFCELTGCALPSKRAPERIRILSRDVRVHPRYEGLLQITAMLVNKAPHRQPYPRMQFTLYNVNGRPIAARIFEPSEYLGRAVAPDALLPPDARLQVALEVVAPEQAAVSFEFEFL